MDRRKTGLLDSGAMSSEDRGAVMQQLMVLVARLEEEMFQSEAHKFEAEVLSCTEQTFPGEALLLSILSWVEAQALYDSSG